MLRQRPKPHSQSKDQKGGLERLVVPSHSSRIRSIQFYANHPSCVSGLQSTSMRKRSTLVGVDWPDSTSAGARTVSSRAVDQDTWQALSQPRHWSERIPFSLRMRSSPERRRQTDPGAGREWRPFYQRQLFWAGRGGEVGKDSWLFFLSDCSFSSKRCHHLNWPRLRIVISPFWINWIWSISRLCSITIFVWFFVIIIECTSLWCHHWSKLNLTSTESNRTSSTETRTLCVTQKTETKTLRIC